MESESLKIDIQENENFIVISLKGKLENEDFQTFLNYCSPFADKNNLIFNLQDLSYISSTGIGSLLKIISIAKNSNYKVILCSVQTIIKKIIGITRLDNIFQIVPTLEKAKSIFLN